MLKDVSIRTKLYGILLLFLLFYLLTLFLAYTVSGKVDQFLDPSKVEVMRQADALRQAMEVIEKNFNAAAQEKDIEILAACDEKSEIFRSALSKLSALDSLNRKEYLNVESDFDIYFRSAKAAALIIIREDIYNRELITHADFVRQTLPRLKNKVDAIANRNYHAFTMMLEDSTALTSMLVRENFIMLLILLAVSALLFPFLMGSITIPLARLVKATRQLAEGDLDVKAEVKAHDEIGELAIAFNEMTSALKEKSEALRKTTEELKVANTELREADRLKSDFLASVSHELRTPLNSIINFSEMILEDWELLANDAEWSLQARDMQTRALNNSKRLLRMINDLLDLAKIEAGHMDLYLQKGDIREIVADSVATVSSLAKSKSLDIRYFTRDIPPMFLMDEQKILQVLINLLSNAIKFTEEGSVAVEISCESQGRGAMVKVIDTGIGLTIEEQAIIFDRFRQAEGADSRKYSGTGLGLNLARQLAELHGGWVRVESRKGEGSVFTLFLPFDPEEERTSQAAGQG